MEGNHDALNDFKVGTLPTLLYISDFITDNEETMLLKNIYDAPVSKWKSLKNRRLQNWGGVVHEKGLVSQDLPSWLTTVTCKIYEQSGLFPSPINHVLINEYLPNQGIMAHQDGPAYYPVVAILSLGSPAVMNFSPHSRLDGENFKSDTDKLLDEHHPFSVLLMPRSLLIFKDEAYSDYLHAIDDSEVQCYDKAINEVQALHRQGLDHPSSQLNGLVEASGADYKSFRRCTTRVSLTCRLVLKVHKNLLRL